MKQCTYNLSPHLSRNFTQVIEETLSLDPTLSTREEVEVNGTSTRETRYVEIVLCIFKIEEDCILPFVKYIAREKRFPSFIFQVPLQDEDYEMRLKTQCFLKVMDFIKDIHHRKMQFERIFKGVLGHYDKGESHGESKRQVLDPLNPWFPVLYAFYDLSDYECPTDTRFCIVNEILNMDNNVSQLFSQHSYLKFLFKSVNPNVPTNTKIPLPRPYYFRGHNEIDQRNERNEDIQRIQHPVYGAFYYFSHSINKYNKTKYAIFDHFCQNQQLDNTNIEPMHSINLRMFTFRENNEDVLCVKNMLDFQTV